VTPLRTGSAAKKGTTDEAGRALEFERKLLYGEAAETIGALLRERGISQRELAERLGRSPSRVSRILGTGENTTLKTVADLGWALGLRFKLVATPLPDRGVSPAAEDPPDPAWLRRQIGALFDE
jgi:transcriptional regulator with XRE-family HTH domain